MSSKRNDKSRGKGKAHHSLGTAHALTRKKRLSKAASKRTNNCPLCASGVRVRADGRFAHHRVPKEGWCSASGMAVAAFS